MKVYTAVLVILASPLVYSWTQQYGDPSSTSYVNYHGKAHVGWKYTTEPLSSRTSPSVTEEGVMFYPLRAYVLALSPRGTVLWKTGVAPNGESSHLTNTVYSKQHNFVVVGSTWVNPEGSFFQIVAIHAGNGNIAWQSMQKNFYYATTISISTSVEAVYAGSRGNDKDTFAALRLKDGSLLWKKAPVKKLGIFMNTKLGPSSSNLVGRVAANAKLVAEKETVLLPTDPYDGFEGTGRLFSYDVSKPGLTNWHSDLVYTPKVQFAFSSNGIIFGSGGSGTSGGAIFGVYSSNGSVLFSSGGYCERGPGIASGPAVDADGYAYYSCGNQVFSIFPNGSLRWISEAVIKPTQNIVTAPSVHPDGYVYYTPNNLTKVMALSTKDGSLHKEYDVVELGYVEPPILLGRKVMYLQGVIGYSVVIYPVKL